MPDENLSVPSQAGDSAISVTSDANAAPAPDATADSQVASQGQPTTDAGQAASQDAPVVDSAPATPADEFKTNPDLRNAYNTVVGRLNANQELLDLIETRGGKDYVQLANDIYDSYIGEKADTKAFLQNLYDLSPTSYNATMSALIEQNRDAILTKWFGGPVAAEDVQAFQQWKRTGGAVQPQQTAKSSGEDFEVPEFDEATGEPIPESVRQMLRQALQQNAEITRAQKAEADAKTAREAEARAQQIDTNINAYQQDRLKVINKTVESLGLLDLPTDEADVKSDKALTRSIIEASAMRAFGADERASNLYRRALTHLENGEEKAAAGLSFQIEAMLASHASKVAERVQKWMQAERTLKEQQVQQAAKGARPEISSIGTANSAVVQPSNDFKPFDSNSIDARLEQLRASGKIR